MLTMEMDQTSVPNEPRPVNVVNQMSEDPRLSVHAVPGRPVESGGPSPMPIYFTSTLSDSGFVVAGYGNQAPGVTAWCPRPPAPVGHVGMGTASGFGYAHDLGNRAVLNAPDQCGSEIGAGFGYNQCLNMKGGSDGSERISGNPTNRNCSDPNPGIQTSGNGAEIGGKEGGDGSMSEKKVKFLCSFGGQILPRPSDGMLRYVGGQTRIISVGNNVRFNELERKMSEVYGQPVVIKYQLPDEDLDALVSVSCPEDLDNMMEEYEKLLERCSDGSAKLRVFLFSASDAEYSGLMQFGTLLDNGQRYVEAVNGVGDGIGSGAMKKESSASVSSNQNSDYSCTDAVDSLSQGQETLDPGSSYVVPMTVPEMAMPLNIEQQSGHDQESRATSFTHPDTYVDPRLQVLRQPDNVYPRNQPPLSNPGSLFPSHQFYLPVQAGLRPVVIQPMMQTREAQFGNHPDEGSVGLPTELNYSAYQGAVASGTAPVSYGWTHMAPSNHVVPSEGVAPRDEETYKVSLDYIGQLGGLMDNLNMRAPEIYTNTENFVSPIDMIGREEIPDSGPLQAAKRGMFVKNTDHIVAAETLQAQSPFLGNHSLYPPQAVVEDPANLNYSAVQSTYDAAADLPSSLSSSTGGADSKDPVNSNSLFSSHDPWNLQNDSHPPRPNKNQIKKGGQDHLSENPSLFSGVLNTEEDVKTDPPISSKDSEEHIKQDLQNVAEGVAASVLQSSTELAVHVDESTVLKEEILRNDEVHPQDTGNKLLERLSFGYSLSDGLDQLQIIKDSDLEELQELGSGTFGTVYHGKWRGTDVAIKRINDRCFVGKPSEQERMIDDFWNEARKLAGLHHPNVVAFYGVVLDSPGGTVATVTEYMVNGSLRNTLQKNMRNLDKRKRLVIAMDIAFGVEYLHDKNIVHFDLKSDNLLVNLRDPHRPICKVGDLGLSKVKCQTLISGGVRGTLPWMAPELLNGISSLVSEKVDVFSFGIVLWELLTGEEPYADLHYGAIIGGIVSNTLRPPIPDQCELDWKLLMERCWSADPSERPSFTEIVMELRSMAAKLPSRGQVIVQQPLP